jgi:ribonuclease PH
MLIRQSVRREYDLREISFVPYVSWYTDGSCVAKIGKTHVLCTAIFEKGLNGLSVEFGVLPSATQPRTGRHELLLHHQEIQDSIKQSLSLVLDLDMFNNIGLRIDCDVLQADGGLRSAAISGAYVATALALKKLIPLGLFDRSPLIGQVASLSCGIVKGTFILDLDREETEQADVIGDFTFNDDGQLVGIYVKSQRFAVPMVQVNKMADSAFVGMRHIFDNQKRAINTDYQP